MEGVHKDAADPYGTDCCTAEQVYSSLSTPARREIGDRLYKGMNTRLGNIVLLNALNTIIPPMQWDLDLLAEEVTLYCKYCTTYRRVMNGR